MTRTYEATPRWGFRGHLPHAAVGGAESGPAGGLQVNPERLSLALLAEEQRQVLSLLGRLRRSAQTLEGQTSPAPTLAARTSPAQTLPAQTLPAQTPRSPTPPLQRRAG